MDDTQVDEITWEDLEMDHGRIAARGLVHPLLNHAVGNDFVLENRAIITGANASGKSTFMKAMAINAILAQTIHTCTADEFQVGKVQVMTCMSLRDDVESGESYYFREAKYLRRILHQIKEKGKVFCVIYYNYYFESEVMEHDIVFDYKIREGFGGKSNAIALLELLGYPQEIVQKAREYVI